MKFRLPRMKKVHFGNIIRYSQEDSHGLLTWNLQLSLWFMGRCNHFLTFFLESFIFFLKKKTKTMSENLHVFCLSVSFSLQFFFHLFFMLFFVWFFLISFATCFLLKSLLYLFISSFYSSSFHLFSLPLLNFLFLLFLSSPCFLMSKSLWKNLLKLLQTIFLSSFSIKKSRFLCFLFCWFFSLIYFSHVLFFLSWKMVSRFKNSPFFYSSFWLCFSFFFSPSLMHHQQKKNVDSFKNILCAKKTVFIFPLFLKLLY